MHSPVPAVARSLRALRGILQKAEAHARAKGIEDAVFLQDRLYPDMLPFWRQVTVACDHAKGLAARLAGQEVPRMEDNETTFAELVDRVERTLAFVEGIPEAAFEGAEARTITMRAGRDREMSLPGEAYLSGFAVPNFFFHMTTAYNILRHRGVELGKRDFMGAP